MLRGQFKAMRQCKWCRLLQVAWGKYPFGQNQFLLCRRGGDFFGTAVSFFSHQAFFMRSAYRNSSITLPKEPHYSIEQGGRSCATARPPVAASAGAPALAVSPSIRAFVAKSVLTRITRYWIHYFHLSSATSTVKMPVFMKKYNFFWQNCKKKTTFMLQKFAMVKYGVFVAKICKHALCASTVRDIWWSPLARQLLPPCFRYVRLTSYEVCYEYAASLSFRFKHNMYVIVTPDSNASDLRLTMCA